MTCSIHPSIHPSSHLPTHTTTAASFGATAADARPHRAGRGRVAHPLPRPSGGGGLPPLRRRRGWVRLVVVGIVSFHAMPHIPLPCPALASIENKAISPTFIIPPCMHDAPQNSGACPPTNFIRRTLNAAEAVARGCALVAALHSEVGRSVSWYNGWRSVCVIR